MTPITKNIANAIIVILTFVSISRHLDARGELPVIKAVGGHGKNVDWESQAKDVDPDGPGFFYNDCAQGVKAIRASSTLPPQGKHTYGLSNLTDDDPRTAWVEGRDGYGIGEYFEILSPGVNVIYNGIQTTPEVWRKNSRVKRFKVYVNGIPLCFLDLTDEMGSQHFELPGKGNGDPEKPNRYKFEIVDVYKGTRWADTGISHIDFAGCCLAGNTEISRRAGGIPISRMGDGASILGYDVESGRTHDVTAVKLVKQTHLEMLKVSTPTKQIELRPDHPLYIKGFGFISIARVLRKLGYNNYSALAGKIAVMTWDNKTQKTQFEPVESIAIERGVFGTYTIRKLSDGDIFIANGFVTRVYETNPE